MGNYSTKNIMVFEAVKLVSNPRHFSATDDMPAATYLTIVHGTKGGEDVFVDAKVVRGAVLFAGLRKGDLCCTIKGRYELTRDRNGNLRGKIYDADIVTTVDLKARAEEAGKTSDKAAATADVAPADSDGEVDADQAPAFD